MYLLSFRSKSLERQSLFCPTSLHEVTMWADNYILTEFMMPLVLLRPFIIIAAHMTSDKPHASKTVHDNTFLTMYAQNCSTQQALTKRNVEGLSRLLVACRPDVPPPAQEGPLAATVRWPTLRCPASPGVGRTLYQPTSRPPAFDHSPTDPALRPKAVGRTTDNASNWTKVM